MELGLSTSNCVNGPIKVDVLVGREKRSRFDLIFGMSTIKELGGITITPSGAVVCPLELHVS